MGFVIGDGLSLRPSNQTDYVGALFYRVESKTAKQVSETRTTICQSHKQHPQKKILRGQAQDKGFQ